MPPVPFVSPGRRSWLASASRRSPPVAQRRPPAAASAPARRRRRRQEDRPAAARVEDHPLRDASTARCSRRTSRQHCADCTVIYCNADQDAAKQQQQAEAGADPGRQGARARPGRRQGRRRGRRTAPRARTSRSSPTTGSSPGADYYVSFDNETVGKLQAQTLVDAMKKAGKTSGNIVMINGSPTDPNAGRVQEGRAQRPRQQRLQDRRRVRHPGLEPRQGPGLDGGPDQRGQGRPRRRLRRQRRHRPVARSRR